MQHLSNERLSTQASTILFYPFRDLRAERWTASAPQVAAPSVQHWLVCLGRRGQGVQISSPRPITSPATQGWGTRQRSGPLLRCEEKAQLIPVPRGIKLSARRFELRQIFRVSPLALRNETTLAESNGFAHLD